MDNSSVDGSTKAPMPDPTRARDEQRRVAAREAERAAELREENHRREVAKADPARGNSIDTFA